jgi:hypothetical protein
VATTLRLQLERPSASLPAGNPPRLMFFVAMFVRIQFLSEQKQFPVCIIQRLAEGAKDEAN